MDLSTIKQLVEEKYIKVQKHPEQELYIYNYTAKAQYERYWNEYTINCRGIILDKNGNVKARPFPKFFNLGEMENQPIPNEPFEVYEKMDGSLGILYWVDDKPYIASRASFSSRQAKKANSILYSKYPHVFSKLDKEYTYLFEIIYPENRIVVDYGINEDIVLLAVIHTQSGEELSTKNIGFPVAKKYDGINNLNEIKSIEEDNKEGYVIRFKNNFRLKVKFEEYLRMHKIITEVSNISIWEYLKEGTSFDEVLEQVPDEFYSWVKKTKEELEYQYKAIETVSKSEFRELETRKATAIYIKTCRYPSVMFAMLTGKDYSRIIWKYLRPAFSKLFSQIEE